MSEGSPDAIPPGRANEASSAGDRHQGTGEATPRSPDEVARTSEPGGSTHRPERASEASESKGEAPPAAAPSGAATAVGGLLLLALAVRAIVAARTHLILPDGIVYAGMAERLASLSTDAWAEALRTRFPPLYPLLAAPLCVLGVSGETAALAVALVAGTLVVVPAFFLGRDLLPARPMAGGIAAGLLAACHPYLARPSAEVLSDATLHLFALAAVALAVRALTDRAAAPRVGLLAAAGAASGLAYLARPEGLAPALAIGAAAPLLGAWGTAPERRWPRAIAGAAALGATALLVASPYLIFIRVETGAFSPTLKKDVGHFLGADQPDPEPSASDHAEDLLALIDRDSRERTDHKANAEPPHALVYAADKHLAVIHPLLLALAVAGTVGLARADRATRRGAAALAATVALYAAVLLFQRANVGYLARRHVAIQAALFCPVAAVGLVALADIARRLDRSAAPLVALLLVCAAILLPKTFKARYDHKTDAVHEVAAWLAADAARAGAPADALVAGRDTQTIAYYARLRYVPLGPGPAAETLARARAQGARWVVVYVRKRGPLDPAIDAAITAAGLRLAHHATADADDKQYHWLVYRWPE